MAKQRNHYVKYWMHLTDETRGEWQEGYHARKGEDVIKTALEYLEDFNSRLKPGETTRTLLKVTTLHADGSYEEFTDFDHLVDLSAELGE